MESHLLCPPGWRIAIIDPDDRVYETAHPEGFFMPSRHLIPRRTVQIPDDLWAAVKAQAVAENRPVVAVVCSLLAEGIQRRREKTK